MTESQWIETYILPRSGEPSRSFLGPGDDAAVGPPLATDSPVLTVDAMVEGQHFIADWLDDETLARRLLRCSFSDLSAMGASAVDSCYRSQHRAFLADWVIGFGEPSTRSARASESAYWGAMSPPATAPSRSTVPALDGSRAGANGAAAAPRRVICCW